MYYYYFRCVYVSSTLLEVAANLQCDFMPMNVSVLNCTMKPLVMTDSTNLASYSMVYLIVVCVISIAESFQQTILLVLAGDQVSVVNINLIFSIVGCYVLIISILMSLSV